MCVNKKNTFSLLLLHVISNYYGHYSRGLCKSDLISYLDHVRHKGVFDEIHLQLSLRVSNSKLLKFPNVLTVKNVATTA